MNTKNDYEAILPRGKENAIPSKSLALFMGFPTVRAMQWDIERARRDGQMICSSTTGGYYLPGDRSELSEYVRTLEKRAKGIMKTLTHARKALETMDGQLSAELQKMDM